MRKCEAQRERKTHCISSPANLNVFFSSGGWPNSSANDFGAFVLTIELEANSVLFELLFKIGVTAVEGVGADWRGGMVMTLRFVLVRDAGLIEGGREGFEVVSLGPSCKLAHRSSTRERTFSFLIVSPS